MNTKNKNFVEVCIYEVKPERAEDFEQLVERVAKHHKDFRGVVDVRYVKRTHRPVDFGGVRKGEPAIKLTKKPQSITYILYWELKDTTVHGNATKAGLKKFFKEFKRCLIKPPKLILGERIH